MAKSETETRTRVLIIDDDAEIRYSLHRVLSARGYEVMAAANGKEGIALAAQARPEVIFLDNRMEGLTGIETLQHLRNQPHEAMVILMTAFGTTQTAIEAMKFGAFDYVVKPFDIKRILTLTENAVNSFQDLQTARGEYQPVVNFEDYREGLVGRSEPMQEVFKTIGQVAASDVTVMITGESGTGKELVARCVWQHGTRADKPFIAVNCAAIPENLIESELFGHERGAFTGATNQRTGKFEQCDGGTLFLDEIGDMALATQTKILRVLQDGEIQRVGGSGTIKVDVRLVAATNRDLEKMVAEKTFREDLYYRLNVVRIRMPALKERLDDIPALVDFMLQRMVRRGATQVRQVAPEALAILRQYPWPGNVRELENVIERSAVIAQGEMILVRDLPDDIVRRVRDRKAAPPAEEVRPEAAEAVADAPPAREVTAESAAPGSPPASSPPPSPAPAASSAQAPPAPSANDDHGMNGLGGLSRDEVFDLLYQTVRETEDKQILQFIEKEMIRRALAETKGNQVKTSGLLGITRATLRKRIDQNQIRF